MTNPTRKLSASTLLALIEANYDGDIHLRLEILHEREILSALRSRAETIKWDIARSENELRAVETKIEEHEGNILGLRLKESK